MLPVTKERLDSNSPLRIVWDVLLPGATARATCGAGSVFEVPAHAKFELQVTTVTDYCCSYVQ